MHLNGKVALITGGARGLGKAFCKGLLHKGVQVCFCDIHSEGQETLKELQETFGEENVNYVQCDVSDYNALEDLFKKTLDRYGALDILVNNAGILEECHWRETINTNLTGVINGCCIAEKYMKDGGVVINVSSNAGVDPLELVPVYSATKAGVVAYTRCLAQSAETHKTGIRYVCYCMGKTNAGMMLPLLTADGAAKHGLRAHFDVEMSDLASLEYVVDNLFYLLETENNNGGVLLLYKDGGRDARRYVYGGPSSV